MGAYAAAGEHGLPCRTSDAQSMPGEEDSRDSPATCCYCRRKRHPCPAMPPPNSATTPYTSCSHQEPLGPQKQCHVPGLAPLRLHHHLWIHGHQRQAVEPARQGGGHDLQGPQRRRHARAVLAGRQLGGVGLGRRRCQGGWRWRWRRRCGMLLVCMGLMPECMLCAASKLCSRCHQACHRAGTGWAGEGHAVVPRRQKLCF